MTPETPSEFESARDEAVFDAHGLCESPISYGCVDAFKCAFDKGRAYEQRRAGKLMAALEYYAHPDHYEERITLSGARPPGVLTSKGDKARKALAKARAQVGE